MKNFEDLNNSPNGINVFGSYYDHNTYVIKLEGILDTYNSDDFGNVTHLELINKSINNLVIDLEKLTYISSTGVGKIVSLFIKMNEKKINIFIYKMPEKIQEIFQLLGFLSLFNLIEDISDIKKDLKYRIFPKVAECPECNTKLKILKPGKFKCSNCGKILRVLPTGEIKKI